MEDGTGGRWKDEAEAGCTCGRVRKKYVLEGIQSQGCSQAVKGGGDGDDSGTNGGNQCLNNSTTGQQEICK
jgi:hypothetical protein